MTDTTECPFCFEPFAKHSERCDLQHCKVPPAAPTVHMNGTGWKDLYEYNDAVLDALNATIKAMAANAPNGRDYYVQPDPSATGRAQDEHWDRIRRIRQIKAEVEYIQMRVSDQEPRR